MPSFNIQRLDALDELLEILYEKLSQFQTEKSITSSATVQFELNQRIRKEILPDIRKYESEYGAILSEEMQEAFIVSEPDAESAIAKVDRGVEQLESQRDRIDSDDVKRLLVEIRDILNDPGKSANAKLKVALPIVPLLASYDLEMDTEVFLARVWRSVKTLWRN